MQVQWVVWAWEPQVPRVEPGPLAEWGGLVGEPVPGEAFGLRAL